MLTLNKETNDIDINTKIQEREKVVAELCTKTGNNIVKECLRNYDPSKSSKELKQIFKRCLKEPLQKTLSYLGHCPEKITKDELVDALILRVKNFFQVICSICKKDYCVKINNIPFLACSSFGKGS